MPTGKTGADAIFRFLGHICRTLTRYQSKLLDLVAAMETAGTITAAEATAVRAFISGASTLCDVFQILANNSGF